MAGRAGPGPHNSICGPGPGQVCTTAAGPARAWASNHVCGPGLGLDFRPVQGPSERGYPDDAQSVDCDCGEPRAMAHLLSCRLLDETCTADDQVTVTEPAKACARKWEKIVGRTRQKTKIQAFITSDSNVRRKVCPG